MKKRKVITLNKIYRNILGKCENTRAASPLPGDDVVSRGDSAGAVLNRRTFEQETLTGTLTGLQSDWTPQK